MLEQIDREIPKDVLQAAMKAVDSRLVAIGGGSYAGLGFKLKALAACGFEDKGRPDPPKKLAAYQKAIGILNQLGDGASMENFLQAASSPNP